MPTIVDRAPACGGARHEQKEDLETGLLRRRPLGRFRLRRGLYREDRESQGAPGSASTPGSAAANGAGGGSTGSLGSTVITGVAGQGVSFCDTRGVAVTSQVPRLTNAQYDRVVNDLLGVSTLKAAASGVLPSAILATDQAGGLTDLGWSTYQSVADMVVTQVMADPTLKKKFMNARRPATARPASTTPSSSSVEGLPPAADTDEIAAFDKIVSDGARSSPRGPSTRNRGDGSTTCSSSRRRSSCVPELNEGTTGTAGFRPLQPRGRVSGFRSCSGARSRTTR